MRRLISGAWLGICVVGLVPYGAAAQTIRGQVIDADSQLPVVSGIVKAEGGGGEVSALTGSNGGFVLSVPDGFQPETLTVERIGYESRTFLLSALENLEGLRLQVDSAPIQLGGIVTTGENLCRREEGGTAVAAIWDEARKSLEVTALTQGSRSIRFETETYERELRPSDYSVVRGVASRRTVTASSPYRAISVERMTERGWVEGSPAAGWELFAPDAAILLTDAFADQHCFRAEVDSDSIFLHFTPNRTRDSFRELEGTLVLDPRTSELTHLRFSYLGIPELRRGGHAGGEIEFFAAPNGLRVVREWAIRAPVLSQVRQDLGSFASTRLRVDGVREHGGRVLAVRAGGEVLELQSEPLDLGEPNSVGDPEDFARGIVAFSRETGGGTGADLVLRNEDTTPFRVTLVHLRDCINTSVSCANHPVDVSIPPGESEVVLRIGKERVVDPFRFQWDYVGEPLPVVETDPGDVDRTNGVQAPLLAGSTTLETPERESSDRFLNGLDIPEGRYEDALEVVASMRPRWLTLRPMQSPSIAPAQVRIYVDGVPWTPFPDSPPGEALRAIPVGAIESIEYVDARTATIRWGTGHQRGAIFVTTFQR